MMNPSQFRKILIRGQEYRYWVGPTHTRVSRKGQHEDFSNTMIGSPVEGGGFRVTQANILNAMTKCFRPTFWCHIHKYRTVRLAPDPRSVMIQGEKALMIACPKCLQKA